jgi:hypothetical protein
MTLQKKYDNLVYVLCTQGIYAFGKSFKIAYEEAKKIRMGYIATEEPMVRRFPTKSSLVEDINSILQKNKEQIKNNSYHEIDEFPRALEKQAKQLFAISIDFDGMSDEQKFQYLKILKLVYCCKIIYANKRLFNEILDGKMRFLKGETTNKRIKNFNAENYKNAMKNIVDLFRLELLKPDIFDIEARYAFFCVYTQRVISETLKAVLRISLEGKSPEMERHLNEILIEDKDQMKGRNFFYTGYFKIMLLQEYRILADSEKFFDNTISTFTWDEFIKSAEFIQANFSGTELVSSNNIERFITDNIEKIKNLFKQMGIAQRNIKDHMCNHKKCILKYCETVEGNSVKFFSVTDIIAVIVLYEKGKKLKYKDTTFLTDSKSISVREIMEWQTYDVKDISFEGQVNFLLNSLQIIFMYPDPQNLSYQLILKKIYGKLKEFCMVGKKYIPNLMPINQDSFFEKILIGINFFKEGDDVEKKKKADVIQRTYKLTFFKLMERENNKV